MSVSDGQLANQTTFNTAFPSRTVDTSMSGVVQLLNAVAASGSSVTNLQREHNSAASYMGKALNSAKDDLPAWNNNDVGASDDDLTERADALTERFNESTGHNHDGTPGEGGLIAAASLASVRLRGYFVRATNLTGVTGTSVAVTTEMTGKTASTGDTVKGVVVSTNNTCFLRDPVSGDWLEDGSGRRVYGRITEAAGVWTLSFYVNIAGVQTAHSFTAQDIAWFYQELYNPITDAPIYNEMASIPSDNATQDVVDASATQRGLVSTGAQSFAGVKTFADTTQSTSKDTGAVIVEGGLGVEKNAYIGGNLVAVGTVGGSNLSGTNTGDITLGAFGSAPDAKGATLSGQELTLQPADATHPGLLSIAAQTIAGIKTFVNGLVLQAYLALNRGDTASAASIAQLSSATSFRKLTGSTATTIHGIEAGADGQIITIHNGSSATCTVKHQSATATAADRLKLPGAADIEIEPDSSAAFIYDSAQSRWVIYSGSGSGSGGGALVVTGTRAAPEAVSTDIPFTGDDPRQMWFIEGSGGHVDLSSNPQIATGTVVGQELILVGRNNDQTVKLEDGNGLSLRGEIYLAADSVLSLFWDGTNWVETSRSV